MKILIIGASSFLGNKLYYNLSKNHEVLGTYFKNPVNNGFVQLDLQDTNAVKNIIAYMSPDVVILCSANADPDVCEKNKEESRVLNVDAVKNITTALNSFNEIKLIFISSDYIFSGNRPDGYSENSCPDPISYYGKTKSEAETIVKMLKKGVILRIPIIYGYNDCKDKETFVTKILGRRNQEIHCDDSFKRYPVLIDDIAVAIERIIEKKVAGIFHLNGPEKVTKYEWANKINETFSLNARIIPEKYEVKDVAPRPKDSRLLMSQTMQQLGEINLSNVTEGLRIIKNQMGCVFRRIYDIRIDQISTTKNHSFRIQLGNKLAYEAPGNADMVIGVPESGYFPATGYAEKSGIPFYFGIIRDYITPRTLIHNISKRQENLNKKLIVLQEIVDGKDVILMDETIISGITIKTIVPKLRQAGAKSIHVRIPSPIMFNQCKYGILRKDAFIVVKQLLDQVNDLSQIENELKKYFKVDSINFLSFKGFLEVIDTNNFNCFECYRLQK